MIRTDYRNLINMGRKAGLNTSELYGALGGGTCRVSEGQDGQADGNGFATNLDSSGHRTFRSWHEAADRNTDN